MKDSEIFELRFHYKRKKEIAIDFLIFAVLFLFVLCYRVTFGEIFKGVIVSGTSMEETLQDGDYLYVNPYITPKHGEIIVIDVTDYRETTHEYSGDYIIKRLIGLEGDVVYCSEGVVYVQYSGEDVFTPLNEAYVTGYTRDFSPVTVGKDEIFFLGDNREVSFDSRWVGCYQLKDLYGVVTNWSLDWKSFFTGYYSLFNRGENR